jgi:ferredoxin, 2Fe-2S
MVKLIVTDREQRVVEVDATPGISLMENIRELDASVEAICGGMCACATCHVYIDQAWLERVGPRSYEEMLMLRDLASFDSARSRLSCQIKVTESHDGIELSVGPEE